MNPNLRRYLSWAIVAQLFLAFSLIRLPACGGSGWYADAIFEPSGRDTSAESFAKGDLGIIRKGMPLEDLIAAYRHLSGIGMDAETQAAWMKGAEPEEPSQGRLEASAGDPLPEENEWLRTRSGVVNEPPVHPIDPWTKLDNYNSYLRIYPSAFRRATEDLKAMIGVRGMDDPGIKDWIQAQDRVFHSTKNAPDIPATAQGPRWLQQTRSYQIGAACFYAENFVEARKAFAEVSKDNTSPYRALAAYLVARCWAREAFLIKEGDATACLQNAADQLRMIIGEPKFAEMRSQAEAYLDFVRHRLEPDQIALESAKILVARRPGAGYEKALARFLTAREMVPTGLIEMIVFNEKEEDGKVSKATDLMEWIEAMSDHYSGPSPVEIWSERKTMPWLVAALQEGKIDESPKKTLIRTAKSVPAGNPATPSLRWYVANIELEEMSAERARGSLESLLRDEKVPYWAFNRWQRARRFTASSLEDWARFIGERAASEYSETGWSLTEVTAHSLEGGVPLARLRLLAGDSNIPENLREVLATVAWTRSVLLEEWALADSLHPLLDAELRKLLPTGLLRMDPSERGFQVASGFLHVPGLSPGVPFDARRGLPGGPDWVEMTNFENWWCWSEASLPSSPALEPFLNKDEINQKESELARLRQIRSARHWFGKALVEFAKGHPKDKRVPQVLHEFVGITRLALCPDSELSSLSKQAFKILHRNYPKTEWAMKTPYYF